MNVVMNDQEGFIEIQGTAEGKAFTFEQQQQMLLLAQKGIKELLQKQKEALR
jgi:ribonuclease PH